MTTKANKLALDLLTADPGGAAEGCVWYNSTTNRYTAEDDAGTEQIAFLSDIPVLQTDQQCGAEPAASFTSVGDASATASVTFPTAYTTIPDSVTITACAANGCIFTPNVIASSVSLTGFDIDLGTNNTTDLVEVKWDSCGGVI